MTTSSVVPLTRSSTSPKRFLGLIAILLLALTSGAFAQRMTASQSAINTHLVADFGTTIFTDTDQAHIAQATIEAINDASFARGVSIYSITASGLALAPAHAPEIGAAAVTRAQTFPFTPAGNLGSVRQAQISKITVLVMRTTLVGNRKFVGGAINKANGAAAVTQFLVNAAVTTSPNDPTTLQTVVSASVLTASRYGGSTSTGNGAGGAVTGAISQVAGDSNETITDSDANDSLVQVVIKAAVVAAPANVAQISNAIGFAFAGTYLATTGNGAVDVKTFVRDNLTNGTNGLVDIIEGALRSNRRTARLVAGLHQTIVEQIVAGVSLAYSGFPNYDIISGPGAQGVAQFAYNNGNLPATTDVTGL